MTTHTVEGEVMEMEFDPVKAPYRIDEQKFPVEGPLEEQFAFLIRYGILAPSSYNTQPWRFELWNDGIAVYADYTRRLPVADPGNRELLMGVGAAIFNLRVAATHFLFTSRVDVNQSDDSEQPIAFVSLTPSSPGRTPDPLESLFPSITKRHTNRNPFLMARVPEVVLKNLRALAEGTQVSLHVSTDGNLNQQVADLVSAADRVQLANPSIRQEQAEWVHPNWSKKTDGVPGAALGVKGVTSLFAPWATKALDLGRQRGAADRNLCTQAPGLVVLYSEDSVRHWLEVGQVLEHLLLTIVRDGLHYSFFNMPIEVPELRTRLRGGLGLSAWPQLLLRIGYCLAPPTPTPRRPVDDVLVRRGPTRPKIHLQ